MLYRVKTFDNFHYTDTSESDESGTFATYEEAVAEAKRIVDESLRWERGQMKDQTDPDELYDRYMDFGDDPGVTPEPEGEHFSA
jgi:hypothetical protein